MFIESPNVDLAYTEFIGAFYWLLKASGRKSTSALLPKFYLREADSRLNGEGISCSSTMVNPGAKALKLSTLRSTLI
jgi:hypothetical protein